ncbi:hypothetical protein JTB14_032695 [Gonioctena quinquepunctata]|nr:hypothetical protein JTB14_032695 [Gonioctena quinquepunctata]
MKNRSVIPKPGFRRLLAKALEETGLKLETNIKSGFKASGLIPPNRTVVLNELPKKITTMDDISKNWSTTLSTFFRNSRIPENEPRKKGKKLDVPAGQGNTAEHLNAENPSSSVAMDDEILADEVLEEAEAEEEEVETCSNEDSDNENITFVANDYVLVQLKYPDNKTEYYVGRITSVVDDNLLVVNILRSKDSLKVLLSY